MLLVVTIPDYLSGESFNCSEETDSNGTPVDVPACTTSGHYLLAVNPTLTLDDYRT